MSIGRRRSIHRIARREKGSRRGSRSGHTPLLNNKCVLGKQGTPNGFVEGLCDGVILAEKGSEFLKHWLLSYKSHRSKGHN